MRPATLVTMLPQREESSSGHGSCLPERTICSYFPVLISMIIPGIIRYIISVIFSLSGRMVCRTRNSSVTALGLAEEPWREALPQLPSALNSELVVADSSGFME